MEPTPSCSLFPFRPVYACIPIRDSLITFYGIVLDIRLPRQCSVNLLNGISICCRTPDVYKNFTENILNDSLYLNFILPRNLTYMIHNFVHPHSFHKRSV
ncbi:hypothetical protein MS3_00007098 [Schistosoma haematobium]|uniref:Uncharacterized protein n=1 Tax=Schistosoma haematobium TaxID=6185 RepID=A0A922LII9_SCHHA|nr:hypothetical protein MS3_00007098 [Schistosoma haematobium]KAH9586040.1 hypothetical protein MS3_00007098 [Schistosoma haematobium]